MKELLEMRMEGERKSIQHLNAGMGRIAAHENSARLVQELLAAEMGKLGFDDVDEDSLGTVYGIIRGVERGEPLWVIAHSDDHRACALSAVCAAGAIKGSLLPLRGDLIVSCVSRSLFGNYAVEHFYEEVLKHRYPAIKGVLLSEPTGGSVNLGHKGRVEYEIVVRGHVAGRVLQSGGVNMLGTIFPLVSELEKVSEGLPRDTALGRSSLRIKDIHYNTPPEGGSPQEFRVAVDRVFVPEESPGAILERARGIATAIYRSCADLDVSTALVRNRYETPQGAEEIVSEWKPWIMAGHDPFALSSLEALREGGFKPEFGYWKQTFTEGSFTRGKLGLPTLGFGPGGEEAGSGEPSAREIERAALGQALIMHRAIGIPSFGWDADEI